MAGNEKNLLQKLKTATTTTKKKQVKSGLALKYKKLFSKPINYDIAINM